MNQQISILINLSTQRFLSSNEENELVKHLRSLEESEAFNILKISISKKSSIGINVYKRVLHKKEYVKNIFKYQVNTYKIQEIKPWLIFLISKIGVKSTIFLIKELDNDENKLLFKALYWLPSLVPQNNKSIQNLLQQSIKN